MLRTAGDQAGQHLAQFGSHGEVSLTRQRNHRAVFTGGYGDSERTHGSLLTTRHQRATNQHPRRTEPLQTGPGEPGYWA